MTTTKRAWAMFVVLLMTLGLFPNAFWGVLDFPVAASNGSDLQVDEGNRVISVYTEKGWAALSSYSFWGNMMYVNQDQKEVWAVNRDFYNAMRTEAQNKPGSPINAAFDEFDESVLIMQKAGQCEEFWGNCPVPMDFTGYTIRLENDLVFSGIVSPSGINNADRPAHIYKNAVPVLRGLGSGAILEGNGKTITIDGKKTLDHFGSQGATFVAYSRLDFDNVNADSDSFINIPISATEKVLEAWDDEFWQTVFKFTDNRSAYLQDGLVMGSKLKGAGLVCQIQGSDATIQNLSVKLLGNLYGYATPNNGEGTAFARPGETNTSERSSPGGSNGGVILGNGAGMSKVSINNCHVLRGQTMNSVGDAVQDVSASFIHVKPHTSDDLHVGGIVGRIGSQGSYTDGISNVRQCYVDIDLQGRTWTQASDGKLDNGLEIGGVVGIATYGLLLEDCAVFDSTITSRITSTHTPSYAYRGSSSDKTEFMQAVGRIVGRVDSIYITIHRNLAYDVKLQPQYYAGQSLQWDTAIREAYWQTDVYSGVGHIAGEAVRYPGDHERLPSTVSMENNISYPALVPSTFNADAKEIDRVDRMGLAEDNGNPISWLDILSPASGAQNTLWTQTSRTVSVDGASYVSIPNLTSVVRAPENVILGKNGRQTTLEVTPKYIEIGKDGAYQADVDGHWNYTLKDVTYKGRLAAPTGISVKETTVADPSQKVVAETIQLPEAQDSAHKGTSATDAIEVYAGGAYQLIGTITLDGTVPETEATKWRVKEWKSGAAWDAWQDVSNSLGLNAASANKISIPQNAAAGTIYWVEPQIKLDTDQYESYYDGGTGNKQTGGLYLKVVQPPQEIKLYQNRQAVNGAPIAGQSYALGLTATIPVAGVASAKVTWTVDKANAQFANSGSTTALTDGIWNIPHDFSGEVTVTATIEVGGLQFKKEKKFTVNAAQNVNTNWILEATDQNVQPSMNGTLLIGQSPELKFTVPALPSGSIQVGAETYTVTSSSREFQWTLPGQPQGTPKKADTTTFSQTVPAKVVNGSALAEVYQITVTDTWSSKKQDTTAGQGGATPSETSGGQTYTGTYTLTFPKQETSMTPSLTPGLKSYTMQSAKSITVNPGTKTTTTRTMKVMIPSENGQYGPQVAYTVKPNAGTGDEWKTGLPDEEIKIEDTWTEVQIKLVSGTHSAAYRDSFALVLDQKALDSIRTNGTRDHDYSVSDGVFRPSVSGQSISGQYLEGDNVPNGSITIPLPQGQEIHGEQPYNIEVYPSHLYFGLEYGNNVRKQLYAAMTKVGALGVPPPEINKDDTAGTISITTSSNTDKVYYTLSTGSSNVADLAAPVPNAEGTSLYAANGSAAELYKKFLELQEGQQMHIKAIAVREIGDASQQSGVTVESFSHQDIPMSLPSLRIQSASGEADFDKDVYYTPNDQGQIVLLPQHSRLAAPGAYNSSDPTQVYISMGGESITTHGASVAWTPEHQGTISVRAVAFRNVSRRNVSVNWVIKLKKKMFFPEDNYGAVASQTRSVGRNAAVYLSLQSADLQHLADAIPQETSLKNIDGVYLLPTLVKNPRGEDALLQAAASEGISIDNEAYTLAEVENQNVVDNVNYVTYAYITDSADVTDDDILPYLPSIKYRLTSNEGAETGAEMEYQYGIRRVHFDKQNKTIKVNYIHPDANAADPAGDTIRLSNVNGETSTLEVWTVAARDRASNLFRNSDAYTYTYNISRQMPPAKAWWNNGNPNGDKGSVNAPVALDTGESMLIEPDYSDPSYYGKDGMAQIFYTVTTDVNRPLHPQVEYDKTAKKWVAAKAFDNTISTFELTKDASASSWAMKMPVAGDYVVGLLVTHSGNNTNSSEVVYYYVKVNPSSNTIALKPKYLPDDKSPLGRGSLITITPEPNTVLFYLPGGSIAESDIMKKTVYEGDVNGATAGKGRIVGYTYELRNKNIQIATPDAPGQVYMDPHRPDTSGKVYMDIGLFVVGDATPEDSVYGYTVKDFQQGQIFMSQQNFHLTYEWAQLDPVSVELPNPTEQSVKPYERVQLNLSPENQLNDSANIKIFYTINGSDVSRADVGKSHVMEYDPGEKIMIPANLTAGYIVIKAIVLYGDWSNANYNVANDSAPVKQDSIMMSQQIVVKELEAQMEKPMSNPPMDVETGVAYIQEGGEISLTGGDGDAIIVYRLDASAPSYTFKGRAVVVDESAGNYIYTSGDSILMKPDERGVMNITAVAIDNADVPSRKPSQSVTFAYRLEGAPEPYTSPKTADGEAYVIEPGTQIQLFPTTGTILYTVDSTQPSYVKSGWSVGGTETLIPQGSTKVYDPTEGIMVPEEIKTTFVISAMNHQYQYADSAVKTFLFQPPAPVQAVYSTPAAGNVVKGTEVVLKSNTENATIVYKIYTSDPGSYVPDMYTDEIFDIENPIVINENVWIQAVAIRQGVKSNVATLRFTVAKQLKALTASVDSGSVVAKGTMVKLTAEEGALVQYTKDGSDPTDPSNKNILYGTDIMLDGAAGSSMSIKAVATKTGSTPSELLTLTYSISEESAYLTADPPEGTVLSQGAKINLHTGLTGGVIYYTTDGTAPTEKSTQGSTVMVEGSPGSSFIIKAVAAAKGAAPGTVADFLYTLREQTPAPSATIPSGAVFMRGATVSLTVKEGTIYYTTDGTAPTTSSRLYTDPLTLNASMTLKAIAVAEDKEPSQVVTYQYTLAGTVSVPTASKSPGVLEMGAQVTLRTPTEGANIYYSTDGSTPDASKLDRLIAYTNPIAIMRPVTIKAIAVKSGMHASEVLEISYTVEEPEAPPVEEESGTQQRNTSTNRLVSLRAFKGEETQGFLYGDSQIYNEEYNMAVSAMKDQLPSGAVLKVQRLDVSDADLAAVRAVSKYQGYDIAVLYELMLEHAGTEVTSVQEMEVGIPIPSAYQNAIIMVSRLNDDGSVTVFETETRRSDGFAYFKTNQLGKYAIIAPEGVVSSAEGTVITSASDAQDGPRQVNWLLATTAGGLAVALGVGGIIVLVLRKRKKQNNR